MANGRKIVTPVFRASFVYVFTPRKNEQSGKDEYSIKMIFDKDADLSDLKAIIKEAIADKWGSNPPRGLKLPLKDGNAGDTEKYPEDKDKFVANAKTTIAPPGVVNAHIQPITDPSEVYSGCYMRATLTAYAYDKGGGKGVSFGLQNLMKVKDGEPLSSRATAENDFAAFASEAVTDEADIMGDILA